MEDPALGFPREVNSGSWQVLSVSGGGLRVQDLSCASLVQARLRSEWNGVTQPEETEIFLKLVSFYLSHSLFPAPPHLAASVCLAHCV